MQTAKQATILTTRFSIRVSKTLLSMLPGPHSFGLATTAIPVPQVHQPDRTVLTHLPLYWVSTLPLELCQDGFPHRKLTGFVPGPTGGIYDFVPSRLGQQFVAVV
jgi:hypothetical protein